MRRVCKKCKVEKEIGRFAANRECRYGREWRCNTCKNRARGSVRTRTYKVTSLKEVGCSVCRETDIACMDFHHLYDKKYEIAAIKNGGIGLVKLVEELQKCCILCANCHRKLHAGRLEAELQPLTKDQISQALGIVVH